MVKAGPERLHGVIISADESLVSRIRGFWPASELDWQVFERGSEAMQCVLNSLPDIIIVSLHLPDQSGLDIVNLLKGENVYRPVPMLLCLERNDFSSLGALTGNQADDFFVLPGDDNEFKNRISLTIARAGRNLDANPLTRLPGNTSIIRHVQAKIDAQDDFAMCYCDIDYFKSFNDKYGFTRGDEVLLMTARLVLNTVRDTSPEDYFVGHVGGDDFIFILPCELAERACQGIIAGFDSIVPQFYDKEEREQKAIVTPDRQGVVRSFPLMTVSLTVVCNTHGRLEHVGQAAEISAGLKNQAKGEALSSYIIDRRQA